MQLTDSQKWWIFSGVIGFGVLVYLLAPILMPFLIAALIAYLGNPAVQFLEKRKIPHTVSAIVVFICIVLIVLLIPLFIIPLLERQIVVLVNNWPTYIDWIQVTAIPWLQSRLGGGEFAPDLSAFKKLFIEHWQQIGGTAASIITSISKSGLILVGWIANLVLIPVVTFYLLRDWEKLVAYIHGMLPRSVEPTIVKLATDCDEVLGTFLRGQLIVMLSLGIIYSIGLSIIGLDLAILLGMLAGVVSFVPYLGIIVGIVTAGIASIMQYHDLVHLIPIVIVFGIGQLIEGFALTPLVIGDRIGLHPIAVVFAVMAGGQLFGFVGVLLALPVAAVIVVLLRYTHGRYIESDLYTSADE